MHIDCPQPLKSLKRKILNLETPSDQEHDLKRSRQLLFPISYQSRIEEWLDSPIYRPQSCPTFPIHNLQAYQTFRSRLADCFSTSKVKFESSWQLTQSRHTPSSLVTDLKDKDGTRNSRYRKDILRPHGIFIQPWEHPPDQVTKLVHFILQLPRASPKLSNGQIETMQRKIYDSAEDTGNGARIRLQSSLFPPSPGSKVVGLNDPLLNCNPFPLLDHVPQISQPKPDLSYGYCETAFTSHQWYALTHTQLAPYANPHPDYFFPFFHVIFTSARNGRRHWVAQNENAGSAAHSVISMEKLFEYARYKIRVPTEHEVSDSFAFSCCIDEEYATLWIHWINKTQPTAQYLSRRVRFYDWNDPQAIQQFVTEVKNIVSWGQDHRLRQIRARVEDFLKSY